MDQNDLKNMECFGVTQGAVTTVYLCTHEKAEMMHELLCPAKRLHTVYHGKLVEGTDYFMIKWDEPKFPK